MTDDRQENLFGDAFESDWRPLARRTDPDTSQRAAELLDREKLEGQVYDTIVSFGDRGCISDEVREHYPNYPYSSITGRYVWLIRKGLIYDTGERRPGKSGRDQRVMCAWKFRWVEQSE